MSLTIDNKQKHLLQRMIKDIYSYKNDSICFPELVSNLHASLQVLETSDQEFNKKIYDLWGNLEIQNALALNENRKILKEQVQSNIDLLKKFITDSLNN